METTIPIPKNIYETIQDSLQSHIDSLARDICKTLDVNEKILLQELRKEKIGIYLYEDDSDLDIKCKSYVNTNGYVYVCCDEPVVYKTSLCPKHTINPVYYEQLENYKCFSNIIINDKNYYINKENKLYNNEFDLIGVYIKDLNKLIVLREKGE